MHAVLASLDEVKRDVLSKGAIQHLVTKPNSSGYGSRASPIEEAFQSCVMWRRKLLKCEDAAEHYGPDGHGEVADYCAESIRARKP
jgi:hypothetical protein